MRSIASAQGWWAINVETGEACRLACFALLDDGRIIGIDSLLDPAFAPETSGEDHYVWLGDNPNPWDIEQAWRKIREELYGCSLDGR